VITAYLDGGGSLENTQTSAARESPHTTKLYDRTDDEITLDEVERIKIRCVVLLQIACLAQLRKGTPFCMS
jgi:hypothetical protein